MSDNKEFQLDPKIREAIGRQYAEWLQTKLAEQQAEEHYAAIFIPEGTPDGLEPLYSLGARVLTVGRVGESNKATNLYENWFHVGSVKRIEWSKARDCFMYTVSTLGGCPENTVISIDDVLRMNFRHDHASRDEDRVIRWYTKTGERVE